MPDRSALPEPVETLIDATVPPAVSGDSGWRFEQRVATDVDADGIDEAVVLIADVTFDARGRPLWEDGHRWQLYVQESDGRREVTRLFARFVPRGKVIAELAVPVAGNERFIVLLEQSPDRIGVYEFAYRGPGRADVRRRLERALDVNHAFTGSPRP